MEVLLQLGSPLSLPPISEPEDQQESEDPGQGPDPLSVQNRCQWIPLSLGLVHTRREGEVGDIGHMAGGSAQ